MISGSEGEREAGFVVAVAVTQQPPNGFLPRLPRTSYTLVSVFPYKEPARWTGFPSWWFLKITSVKRWLWCIWELGCFKILKIDNNLMTPRLNYYTNLSTALLPCNHPCPDSLSVPNPTCKHPVQRTEAPACPSILDRGAPGPGLGSQGCPDNPHTLGG